MFFPQQKILDNKEKVTTLSWNIFLLTYFFIQNLLYSKMLYMGWQKYILAPNIFFSQQKFWSRWKKIIRKFKQTSHFGKSSYKNICINKQHVFHWSIPVEWYPKTWKTIIWAKYLPLRPSSQGNEFC